MVEAHGTGTKLGDPIEYRALTNAFRKDTDKLAYCAIGSIKTNIGHAATAAGVAGVIKILLALRHKQIPPSLNFQSGNSNIDFAASPFYVNTELRDWEVEGDAKRCAAVSSFGFSGTNAHMVIEEAPPQPVHPRQEKPGYLIVLSARTLQQLRHQVEQLATHCEQGADLDLTDMSFTLLQGRTHFTHRLAVVVRNLHELAECLSKWLDKGSAAQIRVAEVDKNEFKEQAALKRYGNECLLSCQREQDGRKYLESLETAADLYLQGYALEFDRLFGPARPRRISLPTYPFAKERYWIEPGARPAAMVTAHGSNGSVPYPLLHRDESEPSAKRFSTYLSGNEFYLRVLNGTRVLPDAVHLEMARAAVGAATRADAQAEVRLEQVEWLVPVVVEFEWARSACRAVR